MLLIIGEINVRIETEPSARKDAAERESKKEAEVQRAIVRVSRGDVERELEQRDPNLFGST